MNCHNCNIKKQKEDYYKGYKTCKECIKERQRKRNKKDKNKIRTGIKKCKKCKENKDIKNFRINRGECKECEKAYGREYNKKNKNIRDKWVNENKDRMYFLQMRWSSNNRDHINSEYRKKFKNNLDFRLKMIQKRYLLNYVKSIKTNKIIRKNDTKYLKIWLEFQFDDKMNWKNHGEYWQIDHVLPISNFNLDNENDVKICFNWKNLMPLKSKKNMIKKNKIIKNQVLTQINNLKIFFDKNKINDNLDMYLKEYENYFATHLVAGNSLEP